MIDTSSDKFRKLIERIERVENLIALERAGRELYERTKHNRTLTPDDVAILSTPEGLQGYNNAHDESYYSDRDE